LPGPFLHTTLRHKTEYADIQTIASVAHDGFPGGHHFFKNLLKLFYGCCIAEVLNQKILSSPQEAP
jgi:hypothetical protein